jgi:hypothetical protein
MKVQFNCFETNCILALVSHKFNILMYLINNIILHHMFVLFLSKMLIRLNLVRNLPLNVILFKRINYMIHVNI